MAAEEGAEEDLPPQLAELIEHTDPKVIEQLQWQVELVEQWQFQSPFLPPAILQQYEQLIPGFSKEYFEAWQRQTLHRQTLEAKVIETQTTTQRRAQPYTFGLGAIALVVAGVLGVSGHEGAAVAVVGFDFLGLGGVFVFGRVSNVREARRKERAVPDPSPPAPAPPAKSLPKGRPTPPRPKNKKRRR